MKSTCFHRCFTVLYGAVTIELVFMQKSLTFPAYVV